MRSGALTPTSESVSASTRPAATSFSGVTLRRLSGTKVLINPNQDPPVAKILNYGKYKYELEKRAKEAKKKQHTVDVKEIKIRYKIDTHDYQVRIKSIEKFIAQGNKVKIVVMLRGREMQHSNLAFDLANKFLKDMENMPVTIEKKPQLEGRNVTLYVAPSVQ